ncbi:MAG: hypothetical protein M3Y13_15080 [Armatimonadota bacterium]|nr:hypothetical protein [Armatimonadota bacterium]
MDNPGADYATPTETKSQARVDQENLKTLVTCHYVLAGITCLLNIVTGLYMIYHPGPIQPAALPNDPFADTIFSNSKMNSMFMVLGWFGLAFGLTLGAMTAYAGKCLQARKRYIFILVIAALNCAFIMPLGTVLGVFTFIVLSRPSVKELFPK